MYLPILVHYTLGQVSEPIVIIYRKDPRGCGKTTSDLNLMKLDGEFWTLQL